MNKNKVVKNLCMLLGIVILSIVGTMGLERYKEMYLRISNINLLYPILINFIFFGGIGIILGIEKFRLESLREGKWRIDIIKLCILGIPAFIFAIPYMLPIIVRNGKILSLIFNDNFIKIGNLILGYVLIGSFYKAEEK